MFAHVYLAQEDNCQLMGNAIAIYTNPSFAQREQENITLPSNRTTATVQDQHLAEGEGEALSIINNNINQINQTDIIPLVNNLEILEIFKDKNKEEGDGVIDALSTIL